MAMRRLSRADRDLLGFERPRCFRFAAITLGQVGDQRRFPTRDRFAASQTAPPRSKRRAGHGCGIGSTRGQPAAQPRAAPHRRHPDRPTRPRAARTSNGNSPTGSRRRKRSGRSSAASATPSGANSRSISSVYDQRAREGKRGRLRSQRDRLCTLTGGSSTKPLPGPTSTLRPHHRACCVAPETPRLTAERLRSATGDDTECRDTTTSSPSPSPRDERGRCAPTASRYQYRTTVQRHPREAGAGRSRHAP